MVNNRTRSVRPLQSDLSFFSLSKTLQLFAHVFTTCKSLLVILIDFYPLILIGYSAFVNSDKCYAAPISGDEASTTHPF